MGKMTDSKKSMHQDIREELLRCWTEMKNL